MPSLVTTAEVNALGAGGGLSDADLQTIIDREEAIMVARFGAHTGSRAEVIEGGTRNIFVRRPISSITSITELAYLGDTATTLASTDYYVWDTQGRIERIYGPWGASVTVTYTPVAEADVRKQVLIELVRLGVSQDSGQAVSGFGFSVGGNMSAAQWDAARERIYARLAGPGDR